MSAAYRGKTSKFSMGSYQKTEEEADASIWCLRNDICITPRQSEWGVPMWYIDIEKGMYPNRRLIGTSPESYGKNTIWEKVAEYQKYYYDKYRNN
jgi:hypothetical protein